MEAEEEEGRSGCPGGSLRTRSQVAPDWTVHESLILVNELCAVEGDCLNTLSSFQKWKIVVENCNALEVNRGLSQCRRHWDSLLRDYNKIKIWQHGDFSSSKKNHSGRSYWSLDVDRKRQLRLPENFDVDLFKAVDDYDKAREGRCDTDPDTDPDADGEGEAEADLLINLIAESGSKNKQRRKRSRKEREKPQRGIKCEKTIKAERCSSSEEKVNFRRRSTQRVVVDDMVEEPSENIDHKLSPEDKEQILSQKLQENAERINATLKGENIDYKLADLRDLEAIQTDIARRQADDLVVYLGNIANTLDQLCKLVQEGA